MKVAFLLKKFDGDEVDAAISTVLNLGIELEKQGHQIYIITERGFTKNKKTLKWSRLSRYDKIRSLNVYRPYAFPQLRSKSILNIPYLLERVLAPSFGVRSVEKELGIKFDIIHSFGAAYPSVLTGWVGKLFSKNKNVKFIHTIKSYSLKDKTILSPGNLFWARFLNLADKITIPTQTMKKKLISSGVNRKKLDIIHSYIKLEKFYPIKKSEMRDKYGFKGKKIILYYGQWGEQKGVHDLIKLSPELSKEIKNLIILLVCPNKLKTHNQKFYEKYKDIGNLHLVEGVVNIVEYINLSDLVVLPYRTIKGTETNPLCIIESVACKTPVVSIDFSDIRDIFKKDSEIILAKPNNAQSLKNSLIRVLSDRNLQSKLTSNAYPKKDNFDIKEITKKFDILYRN